MKYMVLISKHHDGFSQFDSKLTDHDIKATPYGKDIVKQFVDACHKHGLKAGLCYSTRDWFHPDYLVGDNAKYDAWYRGQIEELLSNYGKLDVMWFDHVGGRDWGKWRFDQLFAMMYRLQSGLLVNNRAARFLLPAFIDGMLDALPPGMILVNGCENGYCMDSAEAYLQAAREMRSWHCAGVRLVSPQNRAKYRQQVQAGFGFYLDMYLNPEGNHYYFPPLNGSVDRAAERHRANRRR